jgi:hypothetical protein
VVVKTEDWRKLEKMKIASKVFGKTQIQTPKQQLKKL